MSINLAKALAALAALPTLGSLVNEAVGAIETAVPATGVVGQKIAIVGQYIEKGVTAVSTGVQEVEAMLPIAMTFAAQVLQLAEAVKTGNIAAAVQPAAATPAPAAK